MTNIQFIGGVLLAIIVLMAYEATAYVPAKFDSAFWNLSLADKLPRIAAERRRWLRSTRIWIVMPILVAAGLFAAVVLLVNSDPGVEMWVWLGTAVAMVVAPVAVVAFTIQGAGMAKAAEGDHVPGWLEGMWPVLYDIERTYVIATCLASVMIGIGLLDGTLLASWVPWTLIIGPGLVAVIAVGTDFFFPHMALLGPLVLGVALIIS